MHNQALRLIEQSREYRDLKLKVIGRFLRRWKINPNQLTFLSLVSGIGAIYFLFSHFGYFVLFALLHVMFDGLDGVVARLGTPSSYGSYLDIGVDSFITILLIVKIGYYINDFYPFIIAGLFTLAVLIHMVTKFEAPILFMRSVGLILVGISMLVSFQTGFLIVSYLIGGIATAYSLAKQVQYFTQQ
jgi:phosphatidylglycerophosphate synthase